MKLSLYQRSVWTPNVGLTSANSHRNSHTLGQREKHGDKAGSGADDPRKGRDPSNPRCPLLYPPSLLFSNLLTNEGDPGLSEVPILAEAALGPILRIPGPATRCFDPKPSRFCQKFPSEVALPPGREFDRFDVEVVRHIVELVRRRLSPEPLPERPHFLELALIQKPFIERDPKAGRKQPLEESVQRVHLPLRHRRPRKSYERTIEVFCDASKFGRVGAHGLSPLLTSLRTTCRNTPRRLGFRLHRPRRLRVGLVKCLWLIALVGGCAGSLCELEVKTGR